VNRQVGGGKMGRLFRQVRNRRRCQLMALSGSIFALMVAVPVPAVAATGTIVVSGVVSCQWNPVVGVYVESGGGGSGWAGWKVVDGHTNIATYQAKIQNTSLPTNIRLHVGCGGTPSAWWSDNRTGSTSQAGGPLTGSATLNAVCNEGTVQPPPGDNQRCWFGYASAAAAWAIRHLSGLGADHAIQGVDLVTDNNAYTSWSGLCLAFAASAYLNGQQGVSPSPTVSGGNATAADMYGLYQSDGLVHSASEIPPVGALAFYPGLGGSAGHIGISVGLGAVVSANESDPSVSEQGYNLGAFGNGQYKGWAYPTSAFR
jgi:hypothetical protein